MYRDALADALIVTDDQRQAALRDPGVVSGSTPTDAGSPALVFAATCLPMISHAREPLMLAPAASASCGVARDKIFGCCAFRL